MNLYKFHSDPESLNDHDQKHKILIEVFWEKHKNKLPHLNDKEAAIATSAEYSYEYAKDSLNGPFKLGEAAIATDAGYSYEYAEHILKGRFKLGEAAIAKVAEYACDYAVYILNARFKAGEAAIYSDPTEADNYDEFLNDLDDKNE